MNILNRVNKTANNVTFAQTNDSDQPGLLPGLITRLIAKHPSFLHVDSEDWSEWVDVQAYLSVGWAQTPHCRFAQAQYLIHDYDIRQRSAGSTRNFFTG